MHLQVSTLAATRRSTLRICSPPCVRNTSPLTRNKPLSKGGPKAPRPNGADQPTTTNLSGGRYGHNQPRRRSAAVPALRTCGPGTLKPCSVAIRTPCGPMTPAAPTRPLPNTWPFGPGRIANASSGLWKSPHWSGINGTGKTTYPAPSWGP